MLSWLLTQPLGQILNDKPGLNKLDLFSGWVKNPVAVGSLKKTVFFGQNVTT